MHQHTADLWRSICCNPDRVECAMLCTQMVLGHPGIRMWDEERLVIQQCPHPMHEYWPKYPELSAA